MAMDEEVEVTETEDMPRVYLNKESLGDKQCKPGDSITLKVTDVDPETGDVEAEISGYSHKDGEGDKGYMAEFDRAMPEEEMA